MLVETPSSGGVINPKTHLNHKLGSKFFFLSNLACIFLKKMLVWDSTVPINLKSVLGAIPSKCPIFLVLQFWDIFVLGKSVSSVSVTPGLEATYTLYSILGPLNKAEFCPWTRTDTLEWRVELRPILLIYMGRMQPRVQPRVEVNMHKQACYTAARLPMNQSINYNGMCKAAPCFARVCYSRFIGADKSPVSVYNID